MAKNDANGTGGNPVGGVVWVAPDPFTGGINPAAECGIPNGVGGALAVVEPHHGVHVIITKSTVYIGAGPHPRGGQRSSGGKGALAGVVRIGVEAVIEWTHRKAIANGMTFALIGRLDPAPRAYFSTGRWNPLGGGKLDAEG